MGQAKKKKWTAKGRVKDKISNKIVVDTETWDKLMNEVPKYKLITPAIVSERLKVNGSVARSAIKLLEEKKLIVHCAGNHSQWVYTKGELSAGTA